MIGDTWEKDKLGDTWRETNDEKQMKANKKIYAEPETTRQHEDK
jgi:hypothetical protein